MTNREFHIQCRKNETLAFHRVLNALPHDKFDYSPHEKSQSAARIVWTLVGESHALSDLIDKGELSFGPPTAHEPAHLIEAFDQAWEKLLHQIEQMDERISLDVLLRRDPSPRPALDVHPPDGRQGAVDLRAVRRRSDDAVGEPPEDGVNLIYIRKK